MESPFNNYGLFHRRGPGRQKDVDPELIPLLRRKAVPGKEVSGFLKRDARTAVLASTIICATIGIILLIAFEI